MPQMISTPEAWFRLNKCDFFQIDFNISYDEYSNLGEQGWQSLITREKSALNAWLTVCLPGVEWVVIGPSEYSGWITGGPALQSAVLTPEQVELFESKWGDHPYWRLVERRYEDWRRSLDRFVLWDGVSPLPRLTNWADVPQHGLVALVPIGEQPEKKSLSLLGAEDLCLRISELVDVPLGSLLDGAPIGTLYNTDAYAIVMHHPCHDHWPSKDDRYWDPGRYVSNEKNIDTLMKYFKISVPRSELKVYETDL